MANYELGKKPGKKAGRDATHIAIVPVIVGDNYVRPGDHVGIMLKKGGLPTVDKTYKPHIGIIDPFLKDDFNGIKKGDRVYLCLYPGSVTGLAHVYTHPILDGPGVETSKDWITKWAAAQSIGYDELMDAATTWIEANEDKMNYNGSWSEGGRFEGQGLPAEFWDHFVIVQGKEVPEHIKGSNFFSCSC